MSTQSGMGNKEVPSGAVIGVLGSGQLGRMFTIAARRLGYRVHTYSPDDDTPTGQVADEEITASYNDEDQLARFAKNVDVVTFEFENVPRSAVEVVEKSAPVRPGGHVLHTAQNRNREKSFLRKHGLPTTAFNVIDSVESLQQALTLIGCPAILKTSSWGYDGKGQFRIDQVEQAEEAWLKLNTEEAVLEKFVEFRSEMSVVAARGIDGQFVAFPPIANLHINHILDQSVCPAPISQEMAKEATEITRTVFDACDLVGVMCVEFFINQDDQLLINELAPRPHNSGHLTIDAHMTCQFEQQVRAVCGLPLGSVEQLRPAAMVNLLGDIWRDQQPEWRKALAIENVKLHLYGKREARVGRKMGHLTALADTGMEAAAIAQQARERLKP